MNAECTRTKLRFQGLDGRGHRGPVRRWRELPPTPVACSCAKWSSGTRILGRLSECFTDYRDPDRVEHPVEALIKQRVLGLCLGYGGSQRPRRVVPGPVPGATVRPGRPDGGSSGAWSRIEASRWQARAP